ncbi:MAG: hypothetical protein B7733_24085 [Myxococcales bacterium FL481]|nr:MAG: hypothetical protein B7733_24085 [Myxococcales bacterium FL481]
MLSRFVPGALVRWFARPYVAGHDIDDVFAVADRELRSRAQLTTIDLLGEAVTEQALVDENVDVYEQLFERLARDPRFGNPATRPTVSLKPSAFTCGEQSAAADPITRLAERAHANQVRLTIDMEDHPWTDFTLDTSIGLFERGWDVGTVIQTRLHRTQRDLARFPEGMRVRLVIGIYNEPAAVAITDRGEMKARMVAYAKELLGRGVFVEFATHDEALLTEFARDVAPLCPQRCEVQMLLGVPRTQLQQDLANGRYGTRLPVRIYAPFSIGADNATAYLRRRMDENPSMVLLVLRNLFGSRAVDGTPPSLPPTSAAPPTG